MSLIYGIIVPEADYDEFVETIVNTLEPGNDDLGSKIYTIFRRYLSDDPNVDPQRELEAIEDADLSTRKSELLNSAASFIDKYTQEQGLLQRAVSEVNIFFGSGYLFIGILRDNPITSVMSLDKLPDLIDIQTKEETAITLTALGFHPDQIRLLIGPTDLNSEFENITYDSDEDSKKL